MDRADEGARRGGRGPHDGGRNRREPAVNAAESARTGEEEARQLNSIALELRRRAIASKVGSELSAQEHEAHGARRRAAEARDRAARLETEALRGSACHRLQHLASCEHGCPSRRRKGKSARPRRACRLSAAAAWRAWCGSVWLRPRVVGKLAGTGAVYRCGSCTRIVRGIVMVALEIPVGSADESRSDLARRDREAWNRN